MSDNTQTVSAEALRNWVDRGPSPVIVDVRSADAFARERIPGAVHAEVSAALVDVIPSHGMAVVVCENGSRSRDVVAALETAGAHHVRYLAGGMAAWRAEPRPDGAERRKHARVPPHECRLSLKRGGLFSWLQSNLCARWLDVSEGGLGVLATRDLAPGTVLRARLTNPGYAEAFDVQVVVRHSRPSARDEERFVVGLEFSEPSSLMKMCIRGLVDTGSMPPRHIVAAYARL